MTPALELDAAHPGQSTPNRRLPRPRQYLRVRWIIDRTEAASNRPRLDRRADRRTTGASPVAIAPLGQMPASVATGTVRALPPKDPRSAVDLGILVSEHSGPSRHRSS